MEPPAPATAGLAHLGPFFAWRGLPPPKRGEDWSDGERLRPRAARLRTLEPVEKILAQPPPRPPYERANERTTKQSPTGSLR